MGFTDDKDASRTVRTGFTDVIVVSTTLGNLRKDAFSCTEAYIRGTKLLYKGHQDPTAIFGNFTALL